jgi:hypothetical protein
MAGSEVDLRDGPVAGQEREAGPGQLEQEQALAREKKSPAPNFSVSMTILRRRGQAYDPDRTRRSRLAVDLDRGDVARERRRERHLAVIPSL